MLIRPYEKSDRAAVRDLACATADAGRPLDWLIPDKVFLADILTRYYTDFEPESTLVADVDGRVAGYLNGCRDSRVWGVRMARRIVPAAVALALWRGLIWRPEIRRLLMLNWREYEWHRRSAAPRMEECPAHLHVNVAPGARGSGMGAGLLERFLATLRQAGVPGVRVSVRADNKSGLNFFRRHGFEEAARIPGLRVLPDVRWTSVILTRRLG